MQLTKRKTYQIWIAIIIFAAYLNTILRLSSDGGITGFRLLLPVAFLYYCSREVTSAAKYLLYAVFVVIYSYVISYLPFNRFQNFDIVFASHYALIPFCFMLMGLFVELGGRAYVYNLFKRIHLGMLILGFIQFFFGGVYPNTQDRSPMVNIFFWNENEFATVLAIFLPLYFIYEKRSLLKLFCIISSLFFIVYSDARLLLIGMVVFFGLYYLYKFPLYKYNKLLWWGVISLIVLISINAILQQQVFDEYTFSDLFIEPLHRILTLTPYEGIGSLAVRINAYIWGTIELSKTYFTGIGPGNSIVIMTENAPRGMLDLTAKSFHNILLQMVVELGVLGLVLLFVFVNWMRKAVRHSSYPKIIVVGYYIAVVIFSTILSGAFSNYAFIFIWAFSPYFFRNNNLEEN